MVDKMADNLVGIAPIADAGNIIIFNKNSATITNKKTGDSISMPREEHGLWRISIFDLELINSVDNVNSHLALSARIRLANPTLLDKVLSLHVRMGHASCEAMCTAIGDSNLAWMNAEIKESQIRNIFRNNNVFVWQQSVILMDQRIARQQIIDNGSQVNVYVLTQK